MARLESGLSMSGVIGPLLLDPLTIAAGLDRCLVPGVRAHFVSNSCRWVDVITSR